MRLAGNDHGCFTIPPTLIAAHLHQDRQPISSFQGRRPLSLRDSAPTCMIQGRRSDVSSLPTLSRKPAASTSTPGDSIEPKEPCNIDVEHWPTSHTKRDPCHKRQYALLGHIVLYKNLTLRPRHKFSFCDLHGRPTRSASSAYR